MGARVRYIEQRKRWQGAATHRGRRVCKDFARREQALAWASDAFAAMALGRPVEAAGRQQLSLAKFVEIFTKKYSTNARDRVSLAPVVSAFGTLRLDRVAEWHVRRFIAARRAGGTSNKSNNHSIGALRHAMFVAVREGYLEKRPEINWHALMLPTQSRERVLTADEVAAVRSHMKPWLRDAFDLAMLTGLRFGDLTRITREQIDLKAKTLTLHQRKNARPIVLPLVDDALAIVSRNLPNIDRIGCLLANNNGGKLTWIQSPWKRALRKAGVSGVRWHDLRHTFATRLVEAGAPRDVLASMLGDTPMVAKLYSNVSLEHKRRVLSQACRTGVAELVHTTATRYNSTGTDGQRRE